MIERLGTPDADLQHVADNWQAEWIMVHDALIRALVRLAQERSDAEALRERNEALERERDILKAYSNWAKERTRLLEEALDYYRLRIWND